MRQASAGQCAEFGTQHAPEMLLALLHVVALPTIDVMSQ